MCRVGLLGRFKALEKSTSEGELITEPVGTTVRLVGGSSSLFAFGWHDKTHIVQNVRSPLRLFRPQERWISFVDHPTARKWIQLLDPIQAQPSTSWYLIELTTEQLRDDRSGCRHRKNRLNGSISLQEKKRNLFWLRSSKIHLRSFFCEAT